jgi:hypothetical protein
MTENEDEPTMERGIAQVMSEMAPGAVFTYSHQGVTMKVDKWYNKPLDDINTNRVADHLASRVEGFRNQDEPPWSDIQNRDIDFFRVTSVGSELFPRTVVCKECNAVTYRKQVASLRALDGTCPEPSCDGRLRQLGFVLVCDCGGLSNLHPRQCDQHGYDHLYLSQGSKQNIRTWSFKCRAHGCNHKDEFTGYCDECRGRIDGATPVEAGSVHYSQRDAIVDIPPVGADEDKIPYGEEWCRVLIADHLGQPSLVSEGQTLEEVATTPGTDEQDIEELIEQVGEENRGAILNFVKNNEGMYSRNSVVQMNRRDVSAPDDRNWHTLVSQQLFAFARCTKTNDEYDEQGGESERNPSPQPLSQFVEDEEFLKKYYQAKYYPRELEKIGVEDAWFVDNFPLLNLLFGYTRDTPKANEADLRKFEHPYDDEAVAVYGDRSPSEAIILELDRAAIVEWLLDNSPIVSSEAPDLDDEVALKRWFLENVDPRETQNPFTPIDDDVTELVYTLIHSMSHTLMSTASKQCGLDSDSISELIFPNVPAIVLYAESMEHFALGGMFTLFKTQIRDWVTDSREFARECIYDPACANNDEAACHACMHVSEFTCENFNANLDRNMLVGTGDRYDAFWDVDV